MHNNGDYKMRVSIITDDREYGYTASLETNMRIEELWTKIQALIRDSAKITFESDMVAP